MSSANRPKRGGSRTKSERFAARVSVGLKKLFQEAAGIHGTTLTDFVITSAQEAAKRTVQEYEIMKLSDIDRKTFIGALIDPPPPSPSLRAAAEHFKKTIGS